MLGELIVSRRNGSRRRLGSSPQGGTWPQDRMTRLRAILRSRRQLDIKDTAETGSRGNSRAMD